MSNTFPYRVQLVVSGKFFVLFLIALSLLGGGYYWYRQQQEAQERQRLTQERFKAPPYFVNRGATIIRNCGRCLGLGKLKPQPDWKIGLPTEIAATEQRWFLAVEDPPMPVTISGVLMLPVHPAYRDDPSFGFDQNRVVLVLYQDLQRKPWIEKPQPPPVDPQPPQSQPPPPEPVEATESADRDVAPQAAPTRAPAQSPFVGEWKNIDSTTTSLTRLLITSDGDKLLVHPWAKCLPVECDWGTAAVEPAGKYFLILWDHKDA